MTPLMAAVASHARSVKVIQVILDAGADVNATTPDGYTALHFMVDVNGPTAFGRTPYDIAALLVRHGAQTEIRSHWGWTPLMRAAIEGTEDEFAAILKAGGSTIVTYPENSLPSFTRGADILEVKLAKPMKVRALLDIGFRVTEKHIAVAKRMIERAIADDNAGKCDREWLVGYILRIEESIRLLRESIDKGICE